jgi:hypothetical protein
MAPPEGLEPPIGTVRRGGGMSIAIVDDWRWPMPTHPYLSGANPPAAIVSAMS